MMTHSTLLSCMTHYHESLFSRVKLATVYFHILVEYLILRRAGYTDYNSTVLCKSIRSSLVRSSDCTITVQGIVSLLLKIL